VKLLLMKTEKHRSRFGDMFIYFFYKDPAPDAIIKSYRSCVYENFRNYNRWLPFIGRGKPILIDNLSVRGNIVDADSRPVEIPEPQSTVGK